MEKKQRIMNIFTLKFKDPILEKQYTMEQSIKLGKTFQILYIIFMVSSIYRFIMIINNN